MNEQARIAGVIGGMGPDATIDFMQKVVDLTPAEHDQDHLRMIVDHNPRIPNRQTDDAGKRADIEQQLSDMAVGLQASGADFIVMPCNTAHGFIGKALENIDIPFVHIVDETVAALQRAKATCIGLMATDACLDADLYQSAIEALGMKLVLPSDEQQAEVMALVFRIKAGDRGADVADGMQAIANSLIERGADIVVGGCTEIPLVIPEGSLSVPFFPSTDILARRTVELCLGN